MINTENKGISNSEIMTGWITACPLARIQLQLLMLRVRQFF